MPTLRKMVARLLAGALIFPLIANRHLRAQCQINLQIEDYDGTSLAQERGTRTRQRWHLEARSLLKQLKKRTAELTAQRDKSDNWQMQFAQLTAQHKELARVTVSLFTVLCLLLFWSAARSSYQWEYLEREPSHWVRYPADAERLLENARTRNETILRLDILNYSYSINLSDSTQTNCATSKVRRFRRILVSCILSIWNELNKLQDDNKALQASMGSLSEQHKAELAAERQMHSVQLALLRQQRDSEVQAAQRELASLRRKHSDAESQNVSQVQAMQRELASLRRAYSDAQQQINSERKRKG